MRLSVVSHSLVHPRQHLFVQELRRQSLEVQEIFPAKWGHLSRQGGFNVHSEGSIFTYVFDHEAIRAIEKFKPDILYVMMEPDSLVAYQMSSLARRLRSKFVCFTWENIEKTYFPFQEDVARSCALVICGNQEAKEIMLRKGVEEEKLKVLPQVGVDTSLFKPTNCDKETPVIFVGRMSPEKGVKLIKEAYPNTKFVTNTPYLELPKVYNASKISVQFSYSTPRWREQSGNYVNLEAMASGLPIITSRCGSIPEYLAGSEAVLVRERDVKGLREAIHRLLSLSQKQRDNIGAKNRDFVVKTYDNRVIARKLLEALEGLE